MISHAPSSGSAPALIIVAQSGRQLAQAAQAAGLRTWVIDRFGDDDTRRVAEEVHVVSTRPDGSLHDQSVLDQVARWRAGDLPVPVLWGGGLEAQPALLAGLAAPGPLLGSSLRAVNALQQPEAVMSTLQRLSIPMPVIVRTSRDEGHWLRKRIAAAGGWHVRPYVPATPLERQEYLQRRVAGVAYSYAFIATATAVVELGFNQALNLQPCAAQPYRYGGAIACAAPSATAGASCRGYAERLSAHFAWRGLCGFDFVFDGVNCQVVDLNPRPTATSHLACTPASTLCAHLAACRGEALPPLRPHDDVHGHLVYYATDAIRIPNSLDWPAWTADRPAAGTAIPAAAPLCSIHAAAGDASTTLALLRDRFGRLGRWLAATAERLQ